MYGPRPVLLQRRNAPDSLPGGGVMSPLPPGRMAKIGRSGARPLDTMISPSEKIGVGAVIFELRAEPPELLPGVRIVAAHEVRTSSSPARAGHP